MPKCILLILYLLTLQKGYSGNPVTWKGAGEYLPGPSITTVMKKMGAEKKISFTIDVSGKVSGQLITVYNKSKAAIPHEGGDQYFTVTGKYDAVKACLLLVITHFRTKPDYFESYLTFQKPDSIYYDLIASQRDNNTVITGVANKLLNTNITAEWVGSFKGGGLGMNINDNISMHILPLRIRFDNPENDLPVTDAPKPIFSEPIAAVRELKIQRTIILDTSFIKVDLYDNGEIDGDTATLLLDGKIVLDKKLLGLYPSTVFLNLSKKNPTHTIELFANNLGSIPPNTALLVLTCRNKRYEINLSSSEKINGSVKLVFKP
ncbi:MAG: hypothetical protein ABIS69_05895 [Sediminibacterium sp.]